MSSWGGNCLSQAPVEAELAAFQLPSSVPLKRRSVSPGGGRGLRGGRFEVAVVGQCQPKITMGHWGGLNPGGQPLTWLAVLVSPVLWPGKANKKATRPVLRGKTGILALVSFTLPFHCAEPPDAQLCPLAS